MSDRRVSAEKLAAFSYAVLTAVGADQDSAEATTGAMIHA
jgi:LDH2 family malate/lactate/ureidoglycolate dehydrogenase